MMKLYRNKQGKKLYPVCSWEENQHKLYNAHDRIMNSIDEAIEAGLEPPYEEQERIERAMEAFDRYVIQGIVYATYEEGCLIKDYVRAYNARH